jgi:hypothetical protein
MKQLPFIADHFWEIAADQQIIVVLWRGLEHGRLRLARQIP